MPPIAGVGRGRDWAGVLAFPKFGTFAVIIFSGGTLPSPSPMILEGMRQRNRRVGEGSGMDARPTIPLPAQDLQAFTLCPDRWPGYHGTHDKMAVGSFLHNCQSRHFTTRRAPTPPDALYIPDASGSDTLYDTVRRCTTLYNTVRRVVQRRTVSYDACTTLYDAVRHYTTLYDASAPDALYDTVRRCTTLYDVVQCRTASYSDVQASYDTVRRVV